MALKGQEIEVPSLPWLFDRSIVQLQSAYILWKDTNWMLKTIEWDKIIGVGTEKDHKSISTVCWLSLLGVWAKGETWWVKLQVSGARRVRAKRADRATITHLEWD